MRRETTRRLAKLFAWVAVVSSSACGGGGAVGEPDARASFDAAVIADAGPPDATPRVPGEALFDQTRLHVVELTVAPEYLATLGDYDNETRVPATIVIDGEVTSMVGVKLKGLGSWRPLDEKPSFSFKTDSFVDGTRIDGLRRFTLNNGVHDESFVDEALGYAAHAAMGQPSQRCSYAWVTFNGQSKGLYILREAIAGDFLRRQFGVGNDEGNLYEGYWHGPGDDALGDFADHPEELTLDDEVEEGRTRDDVIAFAAAVRDATDLALPAALDGFIDVAQFQQQFAIDAVLGSGDSLHYFRNNYYLYHRPDTDRFVYLPAGMDRLSLEEITWEPTARLSRRIVMHAELGPAQTAARLAVRTTMPWQDLAALIDVIDAALHDHSIVNPVLAADIAAFDANKADRKARVLALGQMP